MAEQRAYARGIVGTPIRRCRVVGEERSSVHLTVYCNRRRRSIDYEECRRCTRFVGTALDDETAPRLLCDQDDGRRVPEPERDATPWRTVPVAHVMGHSAVCARPDASIDRIRELVVAPGVTIPIVDDDRALVGSISTREIEQGLAASRPRAILAAADLMASRELAIDERTSIFDAAAFMVGKRLRSVAVVGADRRVVATVDDLALLRWMAAHRDEEREASDAAIERPSTPEIPPPRSSGIVLRGEDGEEDRFVSHEDEPMVYASHRALFRKVR